MFADSLPMDVLTDSEDNGDYNSDEINSDVEVALYGAIHHSYATDGHELTADEDNARTESVSKDSPMAGKQRLQPQTNESQSKTPLNNLFRLLDHKLDVSDDEMDKDFVFNDNTNEIDLIEINDSSDDSDIVVVEDKSLDRKKREKRSVKRNHSSASLSSTPRVQTNISLGNVDNLNETTLSAISAMDQFYNEDNYDSAEEERSFNAMSNNRNDWKIGYSDSFVSTNKSNRYYKSKIICNNCNERGHMARDCPLPKKVPVCHLCGRCGHRFERCPSILCSKCLSSAHKTIYCKVLVNALLCDGCGVRGHETNQCTYNWRKYHLTTTNTSEEPIISNLSRNCRKCCYNCGAIGKHYGFECRLQGMSKHMTPVSPLMSTIRQSHCFNGREDNNRRNDCNQKALYNEFAKSISRNELRSCLSASFNKPLDDFDLCHTIATTTSGTPHTISASTPGSSGHTVDAFHNKNKHIKWIYPDINDSNSSLGITSNASHSSHSTPIARNGPKNWEGRRVSHTVFNDSSSPLLDAFSPPQHSPRRPSHAIGSAHTRTETHRQINNPMQPRSQTTHETNERSRQRRIRRKMKKIAKKTAQRGREHHLLRETNGTQLEFTAENITIDNIIKLKRRKKFRRDRNRAKKAKPILQL